MRDHRGLSLVDTSASPPRPVSRGKGMMPDKITNVVLVHGAFVDGSSWRASMTFSRRTATTSPSCRTRPYRSGDVAATRLIIDAQDGPVVLVGHSYGGAVITEAGTHDKVAALVYIAAFAPDEGESVNSTGAAPPTRRGRRSSQRLAGFCSNERAKFHDSFGADLPAADAVFMADSQVPWAVDAMVGRSPSPPGATSQAGT